MRSVRLCVSMVPALVVAALLAPPVQAQAGSVEESSRLWGQITAQGVFQHLQALDAIATANGGERASGTPGYRASVNYVSNLLTDAGYDVKIQPFNFPFFDEPTPSELQRVSPDPRTFANGQDFATMFYSGAGDVTGAMQAVDVQIPPGPAPNSSTSGCEPADFAGFERGNAALMQRGTCPFRQKADNAAAAGATAAIIFNEGQPGRDALFFGTLGSPGVRIPVLSTSFAVGRELYDNVRAGQTTVRVRTDTISETRRTFNVLAETTDGDRDSVVMAGAHLDSVLDSPGMNDNASGTGAVLETALKKAERDIGQRNKLRFAFWGAEELGLLGSIHYVNTLSERQRARIKYYLNFDVLGSINGFPFVYTPQEGDQTPPDSAEATAVFNDFFESQGLPSAPSPLLGASDHVPFLAAGIPSGGVWSGATAIKTHEQARAYGGVAGEPFDHLINSPFDTIDRINRRVLVNMSQAAAHGIYTFAFRDTSAVRAAAGDGRRASGARATGAGATLEGPMVPQR